MLSPISSSHAQVPFPFPCKWASTYSFFLFAHALFRLDSLPTFTSIFGHMKVVWFGYISQWKRGKKVGHRWKKREQERLARKKRVSFEKEGFLPLRRERSEGLHGPDFGFFFFLSFMYLTFGLSRFCLSCYHGLSDLFINKSF